MHHRWDWRRRLQLLFIPLLCPFSPFQRDTTRTHLSNMHPSTFLFALLAAVVAASPGRQHHPQHHHHEPHGHPYQPVCTTTVTKAQGTVTSTLYTGYGFSPSRKPASAFCRLSDSRCPEYRVRLSPSLREPRHRHRLRPRQRRYCQQSRAARHLPLHPRSVDSLIRSPPQLAISIIAGARPPPRSIDTRRQSLCRPSLLLRLPLR